MRSREPRDRVWTTHFFVVFHSAPRLPLRLIKRLLIRALAFVFAGGVFAAALSAQNGSTTDSASSTTTLSGVYTAAQATRGRDTFAMNCLGCHTTASHTGVAFMRPWKGKPLLDLFQYIRYSMPKSEPGSLSDVEYLQVTAYILQLNGMPDGPGELAADSTSLSRIRITDRSP